jgi:ferredoxin-NADP reductase
MPKWFKAEVIGIIDETPFVKRFILSVPELDNFIFKPGQFITLDLPIGEKRLDRWRSYSIASAPNGTNSFELCIVKKYDGKGTQYLFEKIEVGSELTFKGPDGSFVLPENKLPDHDLVMICTGTGIAPFRSFLQFIEKQHLPHNHIDLIYGARYKSDILYGSELELYTSTIKNFSYNIALSREAEWPNKGYVHHLYETKYKDNFENKLFYLCGWSAMVDEAILQLKAMGVDEKKIIYELYG